MNRKLSWRVEADLHKYCCVLCCLPTALSKEILQWGKDNIAEEDIYTDPDDPTLGREDKPHITLKYGLHNADLQSVTELLEGEEPIKATLCGVTTFSAEETGEPYEVVKVDVESSDLQRLHKEMANNIADNVETHDSYKPHITLAYVKKGAGKRYENTAFEGREILLPKILFTDTNEKATTIKLGRLLSKREK